MLFILALASLSHAADNKKWIIQVDLGITAFHNSQFDGFAWSFQAYRSLKPDNSLMLDFGIISGSNDFYWAYVGGIKYRFRPDKKVSPFVHAGVGLIIEEDYGGWVFTGAAGIDINVSPRLVVPITFQIGAHGSRQGPHAISVGLGYRF